MYSNVDLYWSSASDRCCKDFAKAREMVILKQIRKLSQWRFALVGGLCVYFELEQVGPRISASTRLFNFMGEEYALLSGKMYAQRFSVFFGQHQY